MIGSRKIRRALLLVAVCLAGCGGVGDPAPAEVMGDGIDSTNSAVVADTLGNVAGAANSDSDLLHDSTSVDGDQLVTSAGLGAVRLGMSLDEVRALVPGTAFERARDGDGVALVEVTLQAGGSMVVFAGEDDASAPLDWSGRIDFIETFDSTFRTAGGARVGSLVRDLESVYGPIVDVTRSEIESREYVEFERQPPNLIFRIDYSGIFQTDSMRTREVEADAKLFSIGVSQ